MRDAQQPVLPLVLCLGLLPSRALWAQPAANDAIKVTVTPARTWLFDPDSVQFDTNFPRARLTECEQVDDGVFSLLIRPENKPINHSPWFAFKVTAAKKMQIEVRLRAEGGSIRYRPKISADGRHWVALPAESFHLAARPAANQGILTLEIGPEPLWVAAQEFVSCEELEAWSR